MIEFKFKVIKAKNEGYVIKYNDGIDFETYTTASKEGVQELIGEILRDKEAAMRVDMLREGTEEEGLGF